MAIDRNEELMNSEIFLDVMDDEAIVNYYGPPTTASAGFHAATAFAPYTTGLKKTDKVRI